jgi:CheY-like chemotaxis protein
MTIRVTDTGKGIAPDFLPNLFGRFRQADASASREHGGLGIGLALVKQLVELHGGAVRAGSAGPGLGAEFVVEIPIAPADSRLEQILALPSEPARPSTGRPAPHLKGFRILAVDDEPDALEMVRRVLGSAGAVVETATSAEEAIARMSREQFDVLLSDVGLPGTDGFELIRKLRDRGDRTPAVALTAFARTEDRVTALRAGFQKHIAKPIEPADLLEAFDGIIPRDGRSDGHEALAR